MDCLKRKPEPITFFCSSSRAKVKLDVIALEELLKKKEIGVHSMVSGGGINRGSSGQ